MKQELQEVGRDKLKEKELEELYKMKLHCMRQIDFIKRYLKSQFLSLYNINEEINRKEKPK